MQTFLPYADFERSAHALDSPRLGKQRVEVLQILRALTFPSYGWTNHPATVMWRGRVPALTAYGLAMVDQWTERGAADSTRAQITEFAPEAATNRAGVAMPTWLGNEALHRSHQSNLIRKDPGFYGPQFPEVPGDLEYVWPGADTGLPAQPLLVGSLLMIFRPKDEAQLENWLDAREVSLGEASPTGRKGPKWMAQRTLFESLPNGTPIAVLGRGGEWLRLGEIVGDMWADVHEGTNPSEIYIRPVRFDEELPRSAFPYPALLQDPRSLFETTGPEL